MTNPQKENGSTDIANEIMEAIIHFPFTASEIKVVLFVLRCTWGWSKKEHRMSNTFISNGTGFELRFTKKVIKTLVSKKTLLIEKKEGQNWVSFNKHYDKWVVSKKTPSVLKVQKVVSKRTPKTLNNKTLKHLSEIPRIIEAFNQTYGKSIKSSKGFESNLEFWLEDYSVDDIIKSIKNSHKDDYWRPILTLDMLFRRMNPRREPVDYIGKFLNMGSGQVKTCGFYKGTTYWVDDGSGEEGSITYMSKESMEEEMRKEGR